MAERDLRIFIGLGSNVGDGMRQLLSAWDFLGAAPGVSLIRLSSPYRSAPVDMASANWFTNAVGEIRTDMSPLWLLRHLLAIEAVMGRKRDPEQRGYQDRPLDLDLLYYDGLALESARLSLPHPARRQRLFVLAPMAEIAADFVDCEEHCPVLALLSDLRRRQKALPAGERQKIYVDSWPPPEPGCGRVACP
ncbi:MAG: 2-amino-4-hydroxy-6-hydroxymethyldihydropteridine diphosphokinase [Desulfobulbaceae bacterium]|nr:2-amino-4-hydroxy-6-hydroxymethyldihydropteridine diphosphokinase [Desulfobulbaceae bacterium]